MKKSLPAAIGVALLGLEIAIVSASQIPEGVEQLPGRFRERRASQDEAELTEEQRKQLEQLQAVGYVAGSTKAPVESKVTRYLREQAASGGNFYTSGHAPEAILMDMEGNVLHQWSYEFNKAFPDHPQADKPDAQFWRRAHLYPNGDILVIFEGLGILKLDKDSKLIWAHDHTAHHDLEVQPNGDIYVLTREALVVPRVSEDPILEDFISILSPDGEEKERISLLDCFENSAKEHSWKRASEEFWDKNFLRRLAFVRGDIFHTNSLAVLDGKIADKAPAFQGGNVLLSMGHLDMIAVVDLKRRKVVWSMAGAFALQHDPSITPDGDVLVFDNHHEPYVHSRVIQLDPATRETRWDYQGSDETPFYSRTCGTAMRLSNGNTLITESDNGRVFEVNPNKEIVWEFYSPYRAGEEGELIATLFDMVRLPPDFPLRWIQRRSRK